MGVVLECQYTCSVLDASARPLAPVHALALEMSPGVSRHACMVGGGDDDGVSMGACMGCGGGLVFN